MADTQFPHSPFPNNASIRHRSLRAHSLHRQSAALLLALILGAAACSSDGGASGTDGGDVEAGYAATTVVESKGSEGEASDGDSSLEIETAEGEAPANLDLASDSRQFGAPASTTAPVTTSDRAFGQESTDEVLPQEALRIRSFVDTTVDPLSTFALDVDTGSYSLARNYLTSGQRPPVEEVRVEEFINSFDYSYPNPQTESLGIFVDGGPSPFNSDNHLLRIGVQGERVRDDERPPAHLTFVIDTSGSMDAPNRLQLVKETLTLLVGELEQDDTVAIVTYNNSGDVLLDPTSVRQDDLILEAISGLRSGGSTNLESGLRVGYDLARQVNEEGDINRVIVASDGLANAGVTSVDELARQIRDDADQGIRLMTVGFGLGGFNDQTMEQLADRGDGVYGYVDSIDEAEELFERDLTANLYTLAIDAKIQLEFEADVVQSYRLIGFENRGIRDSDFRNDSVDAGEIGAGHQVTALYELILTPGVSLSDSLERLGEVNLRWEDPDGGGIVEIDQSVRLGDISTTWGGTSSSFKLATTVGAFAEKLRESPYAQNLDLATVEAEVQILANEFDSTDVAELLELVRIA